CNHPSTWVTTSRFPTNHKCNKTPILRLTNRAAGRQPGPSPDQSICGSPPVNGVIAMVNHNSQTARQAFSVEGQPFIKQVALESPATKPLCGYSGGFLLHGSLLAEASLTRTP